MIKKILALCVIVALFSASVFAADCLVNAGTSYQVIDGFGASNAWSDCGSCNGSALSAWLVTHADELFTTTGSGIGLTILRARIPPEQNQWGTDAVNVMKAARDRGAKIMATEWTPPAAWKSNGAVDNQNGAYLLTQYYDDYANYLRDYVNYMKNTQQINLYGISPANEPNYQVGYDGCTWSGEQLRDFVKNNLGPTFAAAGITTKIIFGEPYNNSFSIMDPLLNDAAARNYVDIIGTHFYGLSAPLAYPLAATHGKQYWMTENSDFNNYDATMAGMGLTLARWLHSAMATANMNAFIYWWLASDQKNEGLRGINNPMPKRYYVMGNYSKFIRPGYFRIAATASPSTGVTASAYRAADSSRFVIVATNTSGSAVSQRFVLTGIGSGSFTPYITSSTQDLVALTDVAVSGGAFTYTLPAQSVITFLSASGPTPTYTPTVTGTPPTNTPTSTSTPLPASFLFDDFEDLNGKNNLNGDNYKYSGANSNNFATQFLQPGAASTGNYIRITGTVADYGGFGMNFAASGAADLSDYQGIEFYIKGTGTYWMQFTQDSIADYDYHGILVTATGTWTKVTVLFSQIAQKNGTTPVAFTKNALNAVQWASNGNGAYDLQLDEIRLLYTGSTTPTYTNTVLPPTNTHTRTFTPVPPTATHTQTATNTFTHTASSSSTPVPPTNTNTATYTSTATYTTVNTNTHTITNTAVPPTATHTNTAVPPTATNTSTQTYTNTATHTYTVTYTPSETVTTGGPTLTFTHTFTQTYTFTNTATATNTATYTYTTVPSNTATGVPSLPSTSTHTASATAPASTATNTSVNTATQTPVNTATHTPIPPSATSTSSRTFTPVPPTLTFTKTRTNTATAPFTFTHTPTNTFTQTFTNTFTNTYTATTIPSATYTPTPTNTPIPPDAKEQEIKDVFVYPHPYEAKADSLKIKFTLKKRTSEVRLKIYSSAFRLIREVEIGKALYAGTHVGEIKAAQMRQLANGTYYFVIMDSEGTRSKADKIIILK